MNKMVTVFPDFQNDHMYKDVGMIPYVLNGNGVECYIACYEPQKITVKSEMHFEKIEKKFKKSIVNGALYILNKGKTIDILNIYHLSAASMLWAILYKIVNKKGRIYLKLDTKVSDIKEIEHSFLYRKIVRCGLNKCDVISGETVDVINYLENITGKHILHLPNGVLDKDIHCGAEKNKIIMTVGRLGTPPKNTFLLVETFVKAVSFVSNEWKLVLVGPMTNELRDYIQKVYEKRPDLKRRILITGKVTDRNELKCLYDRCLIYCMPSAWEGFSLAGVEALSRGDFLLTSNLPCFVELSDEEKYGWQFDVNDKKDFLNKLVLLCNSMDRNEIKFNDQKMENYVRNNYSWEMICQKLKHYLINDESTNET